MTYRYIGVASANTGDMTAGDPNAAADSARFGPEPGTYIATDGSRVVVIGRFHLGKDE